MAEVESPCTGICKIAAEQDICIGCWRTLDEIAFWSRASADQKRAILAQTKERAARR